MIRTICFLIALLYIVFGAGTLGTAVAQGKSIAVNGANLAYVEQGEGPPVVLVHGTLLDYRSWAAQMEPLAASHRVIAVSLRHHFPNASSGDLSDYGPRVHAADLAALLPALVAEPVHLVGHSYGAFVVMLVAREHPALVRSLVLEEPGRLGSLITNASDRREAGPIGRAYRTMVAASIKQLDAGNQEKAVRLFEEWIFGPDKKSDLFRASWQDNVHTLRSSMSAAPVPFSCADAGKLKMPTLLVGGAESLRLFPIIMNGLQACLSTAERVEIPRATHGAHVDNPADFNRAVLSFVDRH